jgi:tryptophanyl-tRNA synthetase
VRVLSGIQPSGDYLHIGNYFGALRQFVALQDQHEMLLFIADYHSMNSVRDGAQRRAYTRSVALDYLACGLDPQRAMLFRQSDMPEVTELSWLLSTVTPMGLLERAVSYKDKVAQGQPTDHGLFAYPVLQAADILLYRSQLVPVGQDQKQHIEMARDIALRFNHTYGEDLLVLPEPYIPEEVAVVPGVDGRKMSKSYGNAIAMFAAPGEIKKAVMGIVTDSTPVEAPKDPGTHLFSLWSLFADEAEREEMKARARAGGLGYGEVKKDLLARLTARFAPMRERREALAARPSEVEDVLADGARRARAIARPVLDTCREAAGLGGPQSGPTRSEAKPSGGRSPSASE